jgi:hypothetical protein
MDLLTTYTHHSELGAITALLLTSTLYKSQDPLRLSPACCVFISRSLATASNSGDSSASRAQVLPSSRVELNCQLNYSAISSQPPLQNSIDLVVSNCPAHNISARTT